MLTLLFLLGCTQTEASEPPLPPGAEAFRGAMQSFQTIRMWMRAPERNGLTGASCGSGSGSSCPSGVMAWLSRTGRVRALATAGAPRG